MTNPANFTQILETLIRHSVEFIVVGGVAATLNGSPLSTFDLDVVHNRTPENIGRLMSALAELEAHYRHRADLCPGESHLASAGHQLLMTSFGPLDVLGEIGNGHGYSWLAEHSHQFQLESGQSFKVLDLATLISLKEELGGEKDLAALPILRALRDRKQP